MKPFDKRTVPGLEDCSSDSDIDSEVIHKKRRHDDDIELEIEVKNNEFLKEEPVLDVKSVQKRTNSIWGNVVQDEMLNEGLKKCGVNKLNVKRSVESYTISEESRKRNKRQHHSNHSNKTGYKPNGGSQKQQSRKLPVKDRIILRSVDQTKKSRTIDLDPKTHSDSEIVFEIARILNEPKMELIEKCYTVLGHEQCVGFLFMTQDIEENGGMLVMNGSRRRSPGGVFLNLIKESKDISPHDIRRIFIDNAFRKYQPPHNGLVHRSIDNRVLVNIALVKMPEPPAQVAEVTEAPPIQAMEVAEPPPLSPAPSPEEELEDGEIP